MCTTLPANRGWHYRKASSIPIGPQQLALVPGAAVRLIVLMSGRLVVLS